MKYVTCLLLILLVLLQLCWLRHLRHLRHRRHLRHLRPLRSASLLRCAGWRQDIQMVKLQWCGSTMPLMQ